MPIKSIALPSQIDWPRDEAAHEELPWEIWWATALLDAGGRRFSAHALFMHMAGGTLMVTAALTDLDNEAERSKMFVAKPEEATVSQQRLELRTPQAAFQGSFADGYKLLVKLDDGVGFDLALKPTQPVLMNGGSGQYQFLGVTTTQYSVGHLEASGTIRFDGQELQAKGHAWHDRQWDLTRRTNQLAFTWFGICLENGDTVSVFELGPDCWATIARPDGTHIIAAVESLAKHADGLFKTGVGRTIPRRWKLVIPAMKAELQVGQRLITDGQNLYTGALDLEGSYEGARIKGYGFTDIVGPLG